MKFNQGGELMLPSDFLLTSSALLPPSSICLSGKFPCDSCTPTTSTLVCVHGFLQCIACSEWVPCFVPHFGVLHFGTLPHITLLFQWTTLEFIKRCDWQVSPRATPDQPPSYLMTVQCNLGFLADSSSAHCSARLTKIRRLLLIKTFTT